MFLGLLVTFVCRSRFAARPSAITAYKRRCLKPVTRIARFVLPILLLVAIVSAQPASGWQLVWSDEFNGPAGTPPDPSKWNRNLGGGGWGNEELETYTGDLNNAFQDGKGNFVIRAMRDTNGNFTSARLLTGGPSADTHTADWSYRGVTSAAAGGAQRSVVGPKSDTVLIRFRNALPRSGA
jgi:hypothetical protein